MGALEEAKGKIKEAVGDVTGSDSLRQEGQAQQQKAKQEAEAAKARAEAEAHDAEAESFEKKEQAHQGT